MEQYGKISEGVTLTQNTRFFPFVSTGKERDEETGYGYFGARYMDHELMTMWLSVDPMADKYPSISPYAYCAWNSVKLVDPDGRDTTISINLNDGNINYYATDEYLNGTTVNLYHDGNHIESFSCIGEVGFSESSLRSTLSFQESSDAATVYKKIIGDNVAHQESEVEWNYYNQRNGSGDLVTSHLPNLVNVTGTEYTYNNIETSKLYHFHPQLSGYAWWFPSIKDQNYAKTLTGVQCFLNFTGQQYRFDDIVQKYGIIENPNVFRSQYLPLGINPF